MSIDGIDVLRALVPLRDRLDAKLERLRSELNTLERSDGGNWRKIKRSSALMKEIEKTEAQWERCQTQIEANASRP